MARQTLSLKSLQCPVFTTSPRNEKKEVNLTKTFCRVTSADWWNEGQQIRTNISRSKDLSSKTIYCIMWHREEETHSCWIDSLQTWTWTQAKLTVSVCDRLLMLPPPFRKCILSWHFVMSQRALLSDHTPGQVLAPPSEATFVFVPSQKVQLSLSLRWRLWTQGKIRLFSRVVQSFSMI